jgi:hypothetical protein
MMGTRADFYIGKGKDSTWVGSVSHDGYPEGMISVLSVYDEGSFLEKIKELETYIDPSQGWPWPWKTSKTTDYSYYWTDEGLIILHFYHGNDFSHGEDTAPDYYGIGGLQNVNNVTTAGFMVLGA